MCAVHEYVCVLRCVLCCVVCVVLCAAVCVLCCVLCCVCCTVCAVLCVLCCAALVHDDLTLMSVCRPCHDIHQKWSSWFIQ